MIELSVLSFTTLSLLNNQSEHLSVIPKIKTFPDAKYSDWSCDSSFGQGSFYSWYRSEKFEFGNAWKIYYNDCQFKMESFQMLMKYEESCDKCQKDFLSNPILTKHIARELLLNVIHSHVLILNIALHSTDTAGNATDSEEDVMEARGKDKTGIAWLKDSYFFPT